jgi:hypothetical protein
MAVGEISLMSFRGTSFSGNCHTLGYQLKYIGKRLILNLNLLMAQTPIPGHQTSKATIFHDAVRKRVGALMAQDFMI